jgi:hypothetical protein
MSGAGHSANDPAKEYHSYVMRVRVRPSDLKIEGTENLSIRVEYVNKREAVHFRELSGALNFIADSVRRNVRHPET